ncbi:toll/interleukin-1 receptor domain-containing protein [Actinokineospora bangkokensis]|uniref:TIR domain-containing protein n=1 Tax=Actinokineospora bangkokensis TaxID=1193682 RepID=A0A1Q9LQP9_9PSEU|nr:toll/interleukin-1 receptor domain-containing protein [Actinokineospora bangkokensis]OLR94348.1 hypothetical protein BJP25_11315 [Actinokineospora bangkokensis]
MYQYDAFISYQRGSRAGEWVKTHFEPRLRALLDENSLHEVRVFTVDSGRSGGRWPDDLRHALLHAKVLIPVCTPKYFTNEWCKAEWASMEGREQLLGLGVNDPRGLIHPVVFGDGDLYPDWASRRHMTSFKDYAHPEPQFANSQGYFDFVKLMLTFVEDLVIALDDVPPWEDGWPIHTPDVEPLGPSPLPRL